ncbi:MAG TPA: HAD family phosphatase [Draconibacterium sp.]|nr:HAD family phosphatase [Draconibacterium sp.]
MKADLSNIKNIIFDLGRVILNLDFGASIKAFQQLGSDGELMDHKNAYADPVFYNLEVGIISPQDFRNRVRKLLNNPTVTDKQIDDAWYAMILDIPAQRVKTLQQLGKHYNIYLFSNSNQIHIERLHSWFKAEYGIAFPSLFKAVYYSHEINDRKPEVSSFEKVISLSGIDPKETLFVDDLEKNIRGAEKTGLQTLWLREDMEVAELF